LRKIAVILILGTLLGGCSISKKLDNTKSEYLTKQLTGNILEDVKGENITNLSFYIEKAEIEVVTEKGTEKYTGNIKFEKPDKYLISLKSRSGIEGARIYISNDSILVNDRINRKLYYANSFYLNKKYGFNLSCLPLIFGDIVLEKGYEENRKKCLENRFKIDCLVKGISLNYEIDCKKRKISSVNDINNYVQQNVRFKYEGFLSIADILIPKIIEFDVNQYNTHMRIKIKKVVCPWSGSIKFIPGRGYELIELV
jgi:hypothetical protein